MTDKPWRIWFQENTDKFILLITFWTLLGFVVYTMRQKMDEGAVDWARSSTDLVLGGLLGLITGKYLAERKTPPTVETTTTQSTTVTPPPPPEETKIQ